MSGTIQDRNILNKLEATTRGYIPIRDSIHSGGSPNRYTMRRYQHHLRGTAQTGIYQEKDEDTNTTM